MFHWILSRVDCQYVRAIINHVLVSDKFQLNTIHCGKTYWENWKTSHSFEKKYTYVDALHRLLQFKKCKDHHPWWNVTFSKVANSSFTKSNIYGCFHIFLSCTNGTKSRESSHIMLSSCLLPQFSVKTRQIGFLGHKLSMTTLNKREGTIYLSNINYFISDCRFNGFEESMNINSGMETWGKRVLLSPFKEKGHYMKWNL